MDLDAELWGVMEAQRGLVPSDEAAYRLVGLLALRRVLERAEGFAQAASPPSRVPRATFADLAHEPARTIDRTLRELTAANGSHASISVLEAIRILLAPDHAAGPSLSRAINGVARLPRSILSDNRLGHEAHRVVLRSFGRVVPFTAPSPGLSALMVSLVGIKEGARVCDLACGPGVLLAQVARTAQLASLSLAAVDGLAANTQHAALARVLLFLDGVSAQIETANVVVSNPLDQSARYDAILSAPPINSRPPQQLHVHESDRFRFGVPTRSADWLYVQHALSALSPGGRAVLLLGLGALFRSGLEASIRRGLLDQELVAAVVQLPSGLLTSTTIPAALIVLEQRGQSPRQGSVAMALLGDAAKSNGRNGELDPTIVAAVPPALRGDTVTDGRVQARLVRYDEIAQQEYSLLPSRYFDPVSSSMPRSLADIGSELASAGDAELAAAEELGAALRALLTVVRNVGADHAGQ